MNFEDMVGKTITKIDGMEHGSDEVVFHCGAEQFRMFHYQDCCECVLVEDVCGDPDDLIGEPVILAHETSSEADNVSESGTWTFYNISTRKGSVTLRWLGESNGYYSESVDFNKVT